MKPPGPGAVARDSYGAGACGVCAPCQGPSAGSAQPQGRRNGSRARNAPRDPPPGGNADDHLPLPLPRLRLRPRPGAFFAPGLGRGGGKSVTGKDLRSGWWVKGESWGPPTPTRAGAGVFFRAGGAIGRGKCIVCRKNRGNDRRNARFFLRFPRDLTLCPVWVHNEFANPEERVPFPAGENRIERISAPPLPCRGRL